MPSSILEPESLGTVVDVVLRVARMHGSSISLVDLIQLLPTGTTSEDLVTALETLPWLSAQYSIKGELVVPRIGVGPGPHEYHEKQANSRANIRTARWFSRKLGDGEVLTMSVSGSTSYRAASSKDDVDLFCVTRPGTMWLFLAKALLLTRIARVSKRTAVPICLSCVMDEEYAENLFTKDQGALFARDALMAEVVRGENQYGRLLNSAPWMERYFPKLYGLRSGPFSLERSFGTSVSRWSRLANIFLFFTLGSYIRAKAHYHNHLLSRTGNPLLSFRAKVGLSHLIYESEKYLNLKKIYDEIQPMSNEARGSFEEDGLSRPLHSHLAD